MSKKLRALLKAKKREEDKKIPTKLGVVYAKQNQTYEVLPYLDVAKKHLVRGVSIKNTLNRGEIMWVSKENIGKDIDCMEKYRCLALVNKAYINKMDIPCYEDMLRIYFNIDEINKVIDIFKEYGISADRLEGPYIIHDITLASNVYSMEDILVYYLQGNRAGTYQRVSVNEPYLTRLVKHW